MAVGRRLAGEPQQGGGPEPDGRRPLAPSNAGAVSDLTLPRLLRNPRQARAPSRETGALPAVSAAAILGL